MYCHRSCFWTVLVALAAASCGSNPAQPSGSAGGGSSSITAPRSLTPTDGAQIQNADQPITLVVENAASGRAGSTTYTFEVAADAGFASKVQVKGGIAQSEGAQTAVTLDVLPAAHDYYWHARAQSGSSAGAFGPAYRFTVGAASVVNPPVPMSPANGVQTAGWPTFTVLNASRIGAVSALVYRFDVSTSAAFDAIVVSGTVPEGTNRTSYTPPSSASVAVGTTLYWHATAIEQATSVASPASATQSFTLANPTRQSLIANQLGVALWPGVQPTGANGHAVLGKGWEVRTIRSFDGVTFVSPPIEELQVFDLIDRGMDAGTAIAWMKANGYPTTGAWYPSISVVGFPFEYIALINGQWDLVVRVGA